MLQSTWIRCYPDVALFGRYGTGPAAAFLHRLTEKHDLTDTESLVNADGYLTVLSRLWVNDHLDDSDWYPVEKQFHTLQMRIDRFRHSWVGKVRRDRSLLSMAEIARLSGRSDWIDLGSVERERTPSELMEFGIRLHLSEISLSNTVLELEIFGVERSRKAVHDWVQKADLQPASDASLDHIALDETVIRINGPAILAVCRRRSGNKQIPTSAAFTTTITALTQQFLRDLREKHDVETSPEREVFWLVNETHCVSLTPCFSSITPST